MKFKLILSVSDLVVYGGVVYGGVVFGGLRTWVVGYGGIAFPNWKVEIIGEHVGRMFHITQYFQTPCLRFIR